MQIKRMPLQRQRRTPTQSVAHKKTEELTPTISSLKTLPITYVHDGVDIGIESSDPSP
jgi:hypothetical protein